MRTIDVLRNRPEIWDLFTRAEEYVSLQRDKYERFPYYASQSRNIFEPAASRELFEHGYRWEYPEGKPFAVCLTHDIDLIDETLFTKLFFTAKSLKERQLGNAYRRLSMLGRMKKSWWNFRDIAKCEEAYGAHSTFFLQGLTPADEDYSYPVENLTQEILWLSDRGWDIGLHGGHRAYASLSQVRQEKERLERVLNRAVTSYRNHFLRFRVPDTWEILHDAGFQTDTTLGYADCVGFRNGMCHPFHPYNLATSREIEILEIPLVIMDAALFEYMGLDPEKAWDLATRLLAQVESYQGVLTILWHNTCMDRDYGKFYRKILEFCRSRNAWLASVGEVQQWWQRNGERD